MDKYELMEARLQVKQSIINVSVRIITACANFNGFDEHKKYAHECLDVVVYAGTRLNDMRFMLNELGRRESLIIDELHERFSPDTNE